MNARILTARSVLRQTLRFIFWAPVILLSLLLIWNTLPYFRFSPHMPFLEERAVLYAKGVWRVSFYIHIAAGAMCVATALLQFSSWILKKRTRLHVVSGKLYVLVVLLLGAPTGFYMTFFAKGGTPERLCFMFMAILWFVSTYKGFTSAARDRDFLAHKYWMYRSYAMALTAVSFRVFHLIFFAAGMNHFQNYSLSLWISVLGNAVIAESIIVVQARNYLRTFSSSIKPEKI